MDVGGSLCFRARGAEKGEMFGETVGELTSFFNPGLSNSYGYIKDMSRMDLINSLNRVSQLNEAEIIKLVAESGAHNKRFLTETLIARRDYIKTFQMKCMFNPQNTGESITEYTKRIESLMPKQKTYTTPFNSYLQNYMTKSEKDTVEEAYQSYQNISRQTIKHNANDLITENNLLHSTGVVNIESILDNGVVSGQLGIGVKKTASTAGGNDTRSHALSDFFDVKKEQSIKDYFTYANRNSQESSFLPVKPADSDFMAIVFDKKSAQGSLIDHSINRYTAKGSKLENLFGYHRGSDAERNFGTHQVVPVGLPATCIERIIVRPELPLSEITNIQNQIAKRGLDIKLYNTDGVLIG